ncbi:PH domain-containing protein [Allosalinactinospora lopnorensis]|uniref:PH domain-containing protein n=1 Tax=Allosalinactinospora lopnorensis TaxID=1352348 RepID=UPI000623BF68|nr:PH domain-containing protein [Allosalinactinospora lopnorensis]
MTENEEPGLPTGPGDSGGEVRPDYRFVPGALARSETGNSPEGGRGPGAQEPYGGGRGPEAAEPAPAPVPPPEPVYRLSPRSMMTAPVNLLKGFAVPLGVAVVVGNFNPWVLGSVAVAIVGMMLSGLFTYLTFSYQVGSERLEIRQGLINRHRRTIPLERVRGVDITSTLLHRLFGLAVVKVEAAAGGGREEEGKLDAVTIEEAERLRRVLLHRRAVLRGDTEGAGETAAEPGAAPAADEGTGEPGAAHGSPEPETVYFTMPTGWYFYALLSLAHLVTPFAVLAALLGLIGQVIGETGAAEEAVGWLLFRDVTLLIGVAVGTIVVLLLLMPVFAVVSYGITHWGFTLRRRGGALIAERGLFTRQSVTLEYRRIRGYELLDSPLERLRRAVRLRAVVTGLGETATRAMLLPIGDRARVEQVIEQALRPFRGLLIPHPGPALGRRLFRAVAPFAVLAVIAGGAGLYILAGAFAFVALLGVPLGVDRYRSLGHGYDGRRVSVRSGSLRREQAVVGREAIIGWTWSQSLFQRRSGLAHLELAVGAGSGGYTAIDAGFEESVAFAATVTPEMVRPFLERSPEPPDGDGAEGAVQAEEPEGPAS